MTIRRATLNDAAKIADIYTQGIIERIATFETKPRTEEDIRTKLQTDSERHPTIVVELENQVVGWASISLYRPRECYAGIGEFSFYIDRDARGKGVGKTLLKALIDEAESLGYWKLLSRVFPFNQASLNACKKQGFREVGVYEKHAKLDDEWLDVVIIERMIPSNLT
ncbi:MAG: N-acetyltransferase family protein [Sphaerobacteraceae bacterium]|nr:MAG: N-acetyltransferase family protein [Sphaerobacteraceae bacterium]